MKIKVLFILLSIALMQINAYSQQKSKDGPDLVNYSLDAMRAITLTGDFSDTDDMLSPFQSSWGGQFYDATCSGVGSTTRPETPFYDIFTFTANSDGMMDATLSVDPSGCCNIRDTYILLYCSPFNPANPLENLRAGDDDSGISLNSAFMPSMGIELVAGQEYQIVVTNWYEVGDTYTDPVPYELIINSDVTMDGLPVPLSNWPIAAAILAMMVTTLFIMRKRLF